MGRAIKIFYLPFLLSDYTAMMDFLNDMSEQGYRLIRSNRFGAGGLVHHKQKGGRW